MNRRHILTSAAVASIPLAGCSGSTSDETADPNATAEESDGDEDSDGNGEGDGGDSSEGTEEVDDPAPTLDEFAYPDGADRDGVDGRLLFDTHESTLVDAGSLTYESDRTDVFDGDEFQQSQTSRFESNGILRDQTEGDATEQLWSPADENAAYVRMESGFDSAFRVEDRAPPTDEVTGLSEFRRYLSEVEWGEATEVVETADGFGVVYESVGYSDRLSFGEMEAFDASITVSESGHVSGLEYAQTENRDGDTVELDVSSAVTAVGETTVSEPDWADTAREEGIRFDVTFADDGTAFRLELTNGGEVPPDARFRLRDDRGSASGDGPPALSVGDVLFVGISETGDLLTDEAGWPEGTRELTGNIRLTIRTAFPLLTHTRRP